MDQNDFVAQHLMDKGNHQNTHCQGFGLVIYDNADANSNDNFKAGMLADKNNQFKVNIWHRELQGAKNESPANAEHIFYLKIQVFWNVTPILTHPDSRVWQLQGFPFIACLQIKNTRRK